MTHTNRYWQGVQWTQAETRFRVWAPAAREIALVLEVTPARRIPLQSEDEGFYSAVVAGLAAGTRYRYQIDGGLYPDPASRYQPLGPHGPSQIVDESAFRWRDTSWRGVKIDGQVIYEMHIGSFTKAGTFDAAHAHFAHLCELGVTVLELMPVAEFPGRFNWGYDGVSLYAPYHGYGDYDALKRFVDAAHAHDLAVILDVVYNHFGPDGNYLGKFSPFYFTDRYSNEWGDAINYDGVGSAAVREFQIANACYWIEQFHLDGLRLDATQSIHDRSAHHVLAQLSQRARVAAGSRSIILIAENEPQRVECLADVEQGGHDLDAMWNDDFHHSARVALTGKREAYLRDYNGSAQEIANAIKYNFLFQGQYYRWQRQNRGTRVEHESAAHFVHFIQNHDQIANTLRGERIDAYCSLPALRAFTALLLLGPQTPLLFMGQEIAAAQPFPYFADHNAELAPLVFKGRREFLAQFPSYANTAAQAAIPDPADTRTFESAKLAIDASARTHPLFLLHRDLLQLRRALRNIRAQDRFALEISTLGERALALRWPGPDAPLLLIVNLGSEQRELDTSTPLLACARDARWALLWSSEQPEYGGSGAVSPYSAQGWQLPAVCAALLQETPCSAAKEMTDATASTHARVE